MKHDKIAAWGEYQEMVAAGVFYTPTVPEYIPELFDRLQDEAGVTLAKDAEELLGKQLWVLQATAELANMMAKAVDEDFYDIKDWLLGWGVVRDQASIQRAAGVEGSPLDGFLGACYTARQGGYASLPAA